MSRSLFHFTTVEQIELLQLFTSEARVYFCTEWTEDSSEKLQLLGNTFLFIGLCYPPIWKIEIWKNKKNGSETNWWQIKGVAFGRKNKQLFLIFLPFHFVYTTRHLILVQVLMSHVFWVVFDQSERLKISSCTSHNTTVWHRAKVIKSRSSHYQLIPWHLTVLSFTEFIRRICYHQRDSI